MAIFIYIKYVNIINTDNKITLLVGFIKHIPGEHINKRTTRKCRSTTQQNDISTRTYKLRTLSTNWTTPILRVYRERIFGFYNNQKMTRKRQVISQKYPRLNSENPDFVVNQETVVYVNFLLTHWCQLLPAIRGGGGGLEGGGH